MSSIPQEFRLSSFPNDDLIKRFDSDLNLPEFSSVINVLFNSICNPFFHKFEDDGVSKREYIQFIDQFSDLTEFEVITDQVQKVASLRLSLEKSSEERDALDVVINREDFLADLDIPLESTGISKMMAERIRSEIPTILGKASTFNAVFKSAFTSLLNTSSKYSIVTTEEAVNTFLADKKMEKLILSVSQINKIVEEVARFQRAAKTELISNMVDDQLITEDLVCTALAPIQQPQE